MNILSFDIGASGGKMLLGVYDEPYNGDGFLDVQVIHRFDNAPLSIGGTLYWNVVKIYEELLYGILKGLELTDGKIDCLGIDAFCNDYCLLTPSGELLTQMRCYRDDKMVRLSDKIYSIMSKRELYQINGNQNAPFNTLMQLAATILDGDGYLLDKNRLLYLPDLLIYLLSGKAFNEYTLASVSQIFNYGTLDWDNAILDRFKIPKTLFAPIVFPGTINCHTSPETNKKLGIKGFPIANVCEHDTASAFLASVETKPHLIISCGTWAIVGCETDAPIITEEGFSFNIANEGGMKGHHRILRNTMGTWLLQEILSQYRQEGYELSFSDMESVAYKAEPFKWLIDVDNELFYSPGNMCGKIQQYCDQMYGSHPKTIGELTRCVNESLALKYRWCLEKLQSLTGVAFDSINIIGGGSKSNQMCCFTASACNLPIIAGPVEATSYGNMIAQLIALGKLKSVEEGRNLVRTSVETFTYQPTDVNKWNIMYKEHINIIKEESL